MSQVELDDAAANLNALVDRARGGEDVMLVRGGEVLARIVPIVEERGAKPPRRLGLAAGRFKVPDDFDAPLPEDVLALFEGGAVTDPTSASADKA